MYYNFFRINFHKLSFLVAVLLCVGAWAGDYKEAVLVCLTFLGGGFAIDFFGWLERRPKK